MSTSFEMTLSIAVTGVSRLRCKILEILDFSQSVPNSTIFPFYLICKKNYQEEKKRFNPVDTLAVSQKYNEVKSPGLQFKLSKMLTTPEVGLT